MTGFPAISLASGFSKLNVTVLFDIVEETGGGHVNHHHEDLLACQ